MSPGAIAGPVINDDNLSRSTTLFEALDTVVKRLDESWQCLDLIEVGDHH